MNIINRIVSDKIIYPATDTFINNNILNTNSGLHNNLGLNNNDKKNIKPSDNIIINDDHIDINKITKKQPVYGNMFKMVIILFLLYIIISNKYFVNTVLRLFGRRFVCDGKPTCFGLIIQAIILILFYMLFAYLVNKGVI